MNLITTRPVVIAGGGPVGLLTALGLAYYKIPFILLEKNACFSSTTKAGTILTRSIEIFHRFGLSEAILSKSLRVEEIGDKPRGTEDDFRSVFTHVLSDDTQFPFLINLPQHHLEAILAQCLSEKSGEILMSHQVTQIQNHPDHVAIQVKTPSGNKIIEGSYLLACDGGRSFIREQLDIPIHGKSLDLKYMLIDVDIDLDVKNPKNYPYLSYFSDPEEWLILIRHPHCWRFVFPCNGNNENLAHPILKEKVTEFIGEVNDFKILDAYTYYVHHKIAQKWIVGRTILIGDAAHLITPMWALGLNTGILDTSNLCWRLAWVLRGWSNKSLLEGYESEQQPIAQYGSGEMSEAARHYMSCRDQTAQAMTDHNWSNAMTRGMLSVRLDTEHQNQWSMICQQSQRLSVSVGDRIPNLQLHTSNGMQRYLHEIIAGKFTALYFCDPRRANVQCLVDSPQLQHRLVSRRDAPLTSDRRQLSILDIGDKLKNRMGVTDNTVVLVRPDEHIVAIAQIEHNTAQALYEQAITLNDQFAT